MSERKAKHDLGSGFWKCPACQPTGPGNRFDCRVCDATGMVSSEAYDASKATHVEMRTVATLPERATVSFQGVSAEVVNGDQLACGFESDGKPYISVNGVKHYAA